VTGVRTPTYHFTPIHSIQEVMVDITCQVESFVQEYPEQVLLILYLPVKKEVATLTIP
jgi:hypothetical protein